MIRKMLFSVKPILVVNTMPLFMIAQVFMMDESANKFKQDKQIVLKVFEHIQINMALAKEQQSRMP